MKTPYAIATALLVTSLSTPPSTQALAGDGGKKKPVDCSAVHSLLTPKMAESMLVDAIKLAARREESAEQKSLKELFHVLKTSYGTLKGGDSSIYLRGLLRNGSLSQFAGNERVNKALERLNLISKCSPEKGGVSPLASSFLTGEGPRITFNSDHSTMARRKHFSANGKRIDPSPQGKKGNQDYYGQVWSGDPEEYSQTDIAYAGIGG